MAREIKSNQEYRGKLLKLIPSEVIAAYMALQGVIPIAYEKWGLTVVALVLLVITPIYLTRFEKVRGTTQIIFSSLSFIVWVYSLGGPFRAFGLYQSWIATIILILWTLLIPLFVSSPAKQDNS